MSWNYRVGRREYEGYDPKEHDPEDQYSFAIYTVHYADGCGDDDTKIQFTSVDPRDPHGLTLEELKSDVEKMQAALEKPVIDMDTLIYHPIPDD